MLVMNSQLHQTVLKHCPPGGRQAVKGCGEKRLNGQCTKQDTSVQHIAWLNKRVLFLSMHASALWCCVYVILIPC